MRLDATTRRRDGVTLVELQVHGDHARPRTVRVENRLDGPVWYPRRQGVPAPGWDADGYEGTVPAGGRLALGYATPAPPAEPPAAVTSVGDVDNAGPSAADVVADLGDPRPPRDAVPAAREAEPPIPDPVAAWLDDVEAGEGGPRADEALAAVAERVERLRERAGGR